MTFLEFEKPIAELIEQLDDVKKIKEKSKVDVSKTEKELETKITNARKKIFENLTAWQRVQVSRHPDRPYTLA
ncbi:MAG TPA: acetyl-CoA carboxylase carboxyl transferase subunit alpha, partial [Bacteroidia bacterium]|nr:acetyl-CoA carboxylase carboxyl transferase subunit alpha [Bacteroidia bacterium]